MTEPDINELADEIDRNPKVFALRFAELLADVKDVRSDVAKGKWLAFTVLVGVIVDLGMRLLDQAGSSPAEVAQVLTRIF